MCCGPPVQNHYHKSMEKGKTNPAGFKSRRYRMESTRDFQNVIVFEANDKSLYEKLLPLAIHSHEQDFPKN